MKKIYEEIIVKHITEIKIGDIVFIDWDNSVGLDFAIVVTKGETTLHDHKFLEVRAGIRTYKILNEDCIFPEKILRIKHDVNVSGEEQ